MKHYQTGITPPGSDLLSVEIWTDPVTRTGNPVLVESIGRQRTPMSEPRRAAARLTSGHFSEICRCNVVFDATKQVPSRL
ncbi:MAG: hypothetical protein VB858_14980, partial [Planctomycetaceae bacterium]